MRKTSFETSTQKKNNICPVCGTRLSDNATRCLVCGTQLGGVPASPKTRSLDSSGLPEIRLKLPGMIILALVFLALVATIVAARSYRHQRKIWQMLKVLALQPRP